MFSNLDKIFSSLPESFKLLFEEDRSNNSNLLSTKVSEHLSAAKESLESNEFIDINAAESLAKVSHYLIEKLSGLSNEHRQLAVAAIYYFIESDDEEHDFDSILGFDDDISVMNKVLDYIGHSHKKIST